MIQVWVECIEFAKKCYETNKDEYSRRNQSNSDIVIHQIAQGKYAEFLATHYLTEKGYSILNPPDLKIYPASEKSFAEDILAEKNEKEYRIHVKSISHESAEKYGTSWLFQKKDPLIKNPTTDDYMLFIRLGEQNDDCKDICMVAAGNVIPFLKEPRLDYLKDNKVAVYLDDLVLENIL